MGLRLSAVVQTQQCVEPLTKSCTKGIAVPLEMRDGPDGCAGANSTELQDLPTCQAKSDLWVQIQE